MVPPTRLSYETLFLCLADSRFVGDPVSLNMAPSEESHDIWKCLGRMVFSFLEDVTRYNVLVHVGVHAINCNR